MSQISDSKLARIADNKLAWIAASSACVVIYFALDIMDIARLARAIAIVPVGLLEECFGPFITSQSSLHVRNRGLGATCIRVLSFAIELGSVALPGYCYAKVRGGVFLGLLVLAALWIVISLCFICLIIYRGI